jgi:ribosomal protein S18 acetylase RimI-like enzyme
MRKEQSIMAAVNVFNLKNALQRDIQDFGVANTLKDLVFRTINRFVLFQVFRCMTIATVNPKYYDPGPKYTCKFLSREELLRLSRIPELYLSEDFLHEALERDHQCYAILDGDSVAAYGWYSNGPTAVSNDLAVRFHQDYVYMYNGLTHTEYRGRRLHAIGMTRALDDYLKRGFKGIISYVEENNYRSLQSVYRMGYEDFGKVLILKVFGKYFIHSSEGCRAYGFSVVKKSSTGFDSRPARTE